MLFEAHNGEVFFSACRLTTWASNLQCKPYASLTMTLTCLHKNWAWFPCHSDGIFARVVETSAVEGRNFLSATTALRDIHSSELQCCGAGVHFLN